MKKVVLLLIILVLAVVGMRRLTTRNNPELNKVEETVQEVIDESKPDNDFSADDLDGQIGDQTAAEIEKELETLEKELNMLDDSVFDSAGL